MANPDNVASYDEWPVERNAQQLQQREWKIGFSGLEVGAHDRLQIGTLWIPWIAGGFNLHAKVGIVQRERWRFAFETTALTMNLSNLAWYGIEGVSGRLSLVPFELRADYKAHKRVQLGLGTTYAFAYTSPEYNAEDARGAGEYDTWMLSGHVTARASKRLWVITEVDWVLWQSAAASGEVTTSVDAFTSVHGEARGETEAIEAFRGGAALITLVTRAKRFGFRLGIGYGNAVIPRIRTAIPTAIPFGTIDIFARFGGKWAEDDPGVPTR